jgi:hypothetical protein
MRIGFTGTHRGMTDAQRNALRRLLDGRTGEFHHGDCIGADAEAHDIASSMGFDIVIHPPVITDKRAWKSGAKRSYTARSYLARNKDIVRDTDYLIAAPGEATEEMRSGTWSTVRFARRLGRTVWVIQPDGEIVRG